LIRDTERFLIVQGVSFPHLSASSVFPQACVRHPFRYKVLLLAQRLLVVVLARALNVLGHDPIQIL